MPKHLFFEAFSPQHFEGLPLSDLAKIRITYEYLQIDLAEGMNPRIESEMFDRHTRILEENLSPDRKVKWLRPAEMTASTYGVVIFQLYQSLSESKKNEILAELSKVFQDLIHDREESGKLR